MSTSITLRRHLLVGLIAAIAAGCESPTVDTATQAVVAAAPDFTCDPTTVTADTVLRPLADGALVLRPTGEPCRYHLIHRDAGGHDRILSRGPGMYFVTAVYEAPGVTAMCATDLRHHHLATARADRVRRTIDGASIVCAVREAGRWSQTTTVVDGGLDHAPWVYDVEATPTGYLVRWVRDSTFTYLAMNDAGRPATDGVYETTFAVRPAGPAAVATVQTSTSMIAVEVTGE